MLLELQNIKNKIDYLANQSFDDDFLENERRKRVNWVRASKDIEALGGFKNLLTQLYPDRAHFVYELLQNAEDQAATKVYFSLQKDCFYFLHNGDKTFSNDDIVSITSISLSTKKDDTNKYIEEMLSTTSDITNRNFKYTNPIPKTAKNKQYTMLLCLKRVTDSRFII